MRMERRWAAEKRTLASTTVLVVKLALSSRVLDVFPVDPEANLGYIKTRISQRLHLRERDLIVRWTEEFKNRETVQEDEGSEQGVTETIIKTFCENLKSRKSITLYVDRWLSEDAKVKISRIISTEIKKISRVVKKFKPLQDYRQLQKLSNLVRELLSVQRDLREYA